MKTITPEQTEFIERTRLAITRAHALAAQADQLELPVLAREWDYVARCLEQRITVQLQAFTDESGATP